MALHLDVLSRSICLRLNLDTSLGAGRLQLKAVSLKPTDGNETNDSIHVKHDHESDLITWG